MAALQIFTQNVRRLIEQRGLKLTDIAQQVGVSKSYLSIILSDNRKNISDELKDKLANVLGTTVGDLYTQLETPVMVQTLPFPRYNCCEQRESAINKIDSLIIVSQADKNLSLAFYRAMAVLNDDETRTVTKFLSFALENYRLQQEIPGKWKDESILYQASGLQQTKDKLSFEAQLVLAHLAVVKNSCPKNLLLKILPEGIAAKADEYLSELSQANLINQQLDDQAVYITIVLDTICENALHWLTPNKKRNIHGRIAVELALEKPQDFIVLNRIAQHYMQAGNPAEAKQFLIKAQETAFNQRAYVTAKAYLAQLSELSQALEDNNLKAYCAHQTGLISFYLGEYLQALEYFKSALGLYRVNRERYSLAEVHNALGATHLALYNNVNAKKHFRLSLKNLPSHSRTLLKAKLLLNLGTLYLQENETGKAEEYYQRAREFSGEINDPIIRAHAQMGLGILARSSNLQLSVEFLLDALNLLEPGSQLIPQVLTNLGIAYRQMGDMDRALESIQDALDKAKLVYDLRSQSRCCLEIASLYLEMGQTDLAEEWSKQAHEYAVRLRNTKDLGNLFHLMGKLAQCKGELYKARTLFSQGISLLNQVNATSDLRELYLALANVCKLEGDVKNALFYKNSAEKLGFKNIKSLGGVKNA